MRPPPDAIQSMSSILRSLSLVCLTGLTASLQLPACTSRVPVSRVVAQPMRMAVTSVQMMCDAAEAEASPVEEAEAAPVEATEAAPSAEAAPEKAARKAKVPLEELEVGQEVQGKIRSVQSYGAFVDVGATTDALLHVSEISNEFIKDATEKLTAGESVTCKIKAINLEKQQLALTCKEPQERRPRAPRVKVDLSKYESADEKEFVTGKVNSITDFGAFVTLEEGVDGLVHISQVKEGGVGKVSDVLTVGQEVRVRVTSVDQSKRRIGLSMLEWAERTKNDKRGGGGGGQDVGFGAADEAFRMSAEEIETLTVGDEFASPFEAAFERAASVQSMKASKKKFARQVL